MKLRLLTILLLFSLVSPAQMMMNYGLLAKNTSSPITNIKNPQFVNGDSIYCLGGFHEWTRRPYVVDLFYRLGTGHLTGANIYRQDYIVNGNMWSDTILVEKGDTDVRDVYGGRIKDIDGIAGNDSIMIMCGRSLNGIGGSSPSNQSINLYFLRGDTLGHFGTRIPFNWSVQAFPQLQRCYFFSHIVPGWQPGEYYGILYEANVDTGDLSRHIVNVIKTMDWFRTYRLLKVWDGDSYPASETVIAPVGYHKLCIQMRMETLGHLDQWESTDSGHTWIDRTSNDLRYFNATDVIPSTYWDSSTHKQYMYPDDRDNDFIYFAQGDSNLTGFGQTLPTYGPILFYYNQSEDHLSANTSLGYANSIRLLKSDMSFDSVLLITWFHEINSHRANVMWSRNGFLADPGGIPNVPVLSTSFATTTSFRFDVTNFSVSDWNNVRLIQMDLSTDPAFGSFVTAKWGPPSISPDVLIHNIFVHSNWVVYNDLVTATDYYVRVRACNNVGCSAFSATAHQKTN